MTSDADEIVAEAIAASPTYRVPDYRDRVAAHGTAAVAPLMRSLHARSDLGYFTVAVLVAIARRESVAAVEALHAIAADSADGELVKFTRNALRGLGSVARVPVKLAHEPESSAASDEPFSQTATGSVIDKINSARWRRGEPSLDPAESAQILENLKRRAADPRAYRNVCWQCKAVVTEEFNLHCDECNWLVCWCGACREPDRPWPPTYKAGPCPIEAGFFGSELGFPDHDYRGRPIVSANPPALDAAAIREALEQRRVTSVFHWTPARGCESILTHGILSRGELRHAGVQFVAHGYGSHQKEEALAHYVALTFRPKAVMMKAWSRSPVVFEIDPLVVLGAGTLFVPGNSAAATFARDEVLALQGAAAFERMWPTDHGEPVSQAELWVRLRIPRRAILTLLVESNELADALLSQLRRVDPGYMPPIEVRPELFDVGTMTERDEGA